MTLQRTAGRMQSAQSFVELVVRLSSRQYISDLTDCFVDGDALAAGAVEGGDGGRATDGLHAVNQHGLTLGAELFDRAHGVVHVS